MNKISKLFILVIVAIGLHSFAEESVGEKATAKTHDAKRATKKAWHRTKEAVCMKGDVKCAAEKAKHRVNEAGETVGDKASEAKNAVDSDSSSK
jgi:hypothetical protein